MTGGVEGAEHEKRNRGFLFYFILFILFFYIMYSLLSTRNSMER